MSVRLVLVLVASVPSLVVAPAASDCGFQALFGHGCSVDADTDGREVDLIGEVTRGGAADGPGAGPGRDADEENQAAGPNAEPLRWDWTVVDPPEITIEDLASFSPAAGPAVGEPAGWGIVGLETNFYSGSQAQVVEGELLGRPAAVRFTPLAWHWSYGDGARASSSTPGAPWAGAAEFEPTTTSHRYASAGTFPVQLAVEFGAEFRFAGGAWARVAGTVTANAEPLSMRVGTADTVLVEHACDGDSRPGC